MKRLAFQTNRQQHIIACGSAPLPLATCYQRVTGPSTGRKKKSPLPHRSGDAKLEVNICV
jgi:hypothetical protein